MKVITSRFWKVCEAEHCIVLTNKKAAGIYVDFYLCKEHCSEERLEELEDLYLLGKI